MEGTTGCATSMVADRAPVFATVTNKIKECSGKVNDLSDRLSQIITNLKGPNSQKVPGEDTEPTGGALGELEYALFNLERGIDNLQEHVAEFESIRLV